MKHIKDLKLKSKEGLTVKNLERFPSMEYGDEGGLQAEVWLEDHTYVGTLFQAGDGGMADFTWNANLTTETRNQVKKHVFDFLMRNDKDFGPNSQYEFMRDKTPAKIDDDDIEMFVTLMEEEYDARKKAKSSFKKGYKSVVKVDQGYQFRFLQFHISNYTENEIKTVLKKHKIAYEDFSIYTPDDLVLAY